MHTAHITVSTGRIGERCTLRNRLGRRGGNGYLAHFFARQYGLAALLKGLLDRLDVEPPATSQEER
jgi:hypothetical protein